jgi:uncharacterized membrane protein
MISLYGGVWLLGFVYWGVTRLRAVKPISIWAFGLLMLPIVLDGGTHIISDNLGGLTIGFRYHNAWLAALTGHMLSENFYTGDALGSFNSWMRLITGLMAAIGVVWFVFPLIDRSARSTVHDIDLKLEQIAAKQRRLATHLEDAYKQIRPTPPN